MSSTITVLLLIYCHIAWLTGELHLLSELITGKVQFLFQTTKQVYWCLASWAMISCSPCIQNTADIITDLAGQLSTMQNWTGSESHATKLEALNEKWVSWFKVLMFMNKDIMANKNTDKRGSADELWMHCSKESEMRCQGDCELHGTKEKACR